MGDTLAQYRACIGRFAGGRSAKGRLAEETADVNQHIVPWPDLPALKELVKYLLNQKR